MITRGLSKGLKPLVNAMVAEKDCRIKYSNDRKMSIPFETRHENKQKILRSEKNAL